MKKILVVASIAASLPVLLSLPAGAQWTAGAEAGKAFDVFHTDYAYQTGTPDSFINRASGFGAGIFFGHDFKVGGRLFLGFELRAGLNDARWEMDTEDVYAGTPKGGPSHLRYDIPWFAGLSGIAKFRVLPGLAVTADLGMAFSRIRMKKTSASSTSYSYDDWVPALAAGAGLEWDLTSKWALIARFSFIDFREVETISRFPDGEAWETVTGRPNLFSARLGILFRIGGS